MGSSERSTRSHLAHLERQICWARRCPGGCPEEIPAVACVGFVCRQYRRIPARHAGQRAMAQLTYQKYVATSNLGE